MERLLFPSEAIPTVPQASRAEVTEALRQINVSQVELRPRYFRGDRGTSPTPPPPRPSTLGYQVIHFIYYLGYLGYSGPRWHSLII